MDYRFQYDKIIRKAKSENRIKHNGIYYENHHIIPKCLYGLEKKDNKVLLTGKEHFVCHKLLTYIHPNNRKIVFAFHMMCYPKIENRKLKISSRDYKYLKELKNKNKVTEETKERMKISHQDYKGKNHPNFGEKIKYKNISSNEIIVLKEIEILKSEKSRIQKKIAKINKELSILNKEKSKIRRLFTARILSKLIDENPGKNQKYICKITGLSKSQFINILSKNPDIWKIYKGKSTNYSEKIKKTLKENKDKLELSIILNTSIRNIENYIRKYT